MSEVAIVPFTPDRLDDFCACMGAVARERRWLAFLDAPPREQSQAYTEMMLAGGHPMLLAIAEGRVVGWCDISPAGRPVHAHLGILGIGLLPGWRDRGLGARLMQAALDAARAKGLERIELAVHGRNERARRLYERLGFRAEGIRRKALKVDGAYDDVIMMALIFEEPVQLA